MADAKTIMLAPMLILQGKWMRLRMPKLDEAAGPRQGSQGQGTPLSILVFGDSAAAGVGVSEQQHALVGQLTSQLQDQYIVSWKLLAQSGLKTGESSNLLASTPPQSFDVIVISLGVNDAKSTGSPQQWTSQLAQVVKQLKQSFNPKLILVSELPPMGEFARFPQPLRAWLGWRSDLFNQHLRNWAKEQDKLQLTVIPKDGADLAIDGLHPGANTYRLWAKQAAKQLTSTLTNR